MNISFIKPLASGKIGDSLFAVRTGNVNFYVYNYGQGSLYVDSGMRKDQAAGQLHSLGIDPRSVTHLFLTYSDFDHASELPVFENARDYLSADEEPMITGKKASFWGLVQNSPINACIMSSKTATRSPWGLQGSEL